LKDGPSVPYFSQLVQKLSSVESAISQPRIFAFTAANRGDGVTFTARSVAGAFARATEERVLIVEAETLGSRDCQIEPPDPHVASSHPASVYSVTQTSSNSKKWDARHLRSGLEGLGMHFAWIIVDCPPLRESNHALAIAPHTNGVVFVVAAEKTKRSDIAQARRSIELSSGELLGFVLNKRTWPVPDSLYQRF
jgi:Mrp family chromosome partitioning ATPase